MWNNNFCGNASFSSSSSSSLFSSYLLDMMLALSFEVLWLYFFSFCSAHNAYLFYQISFDFHVNSILSCGSPVVVSGYVFSPIIAVYVSFFIHRHYNIPITYVALRVREVVYVCGEKTNVNMYLTTNYHAVEMYWKLYTWIKHFACFFRIKYLKGILSDYALFLLSFTLILRFFYWQESHLNWTARVFFFFFITNAIE